MCKRGQFPAWSDKSKASGDIACIFLPARRRLFVHPKPGFDPWVDSPPSPRWSRRLCSPWRAGVSVRLDYSSPSSSPFPSDRFTQVDWTQNTFKRVKLPKPDCAVRPSDCADIA